MSLRLALELDGNNEGAVKAVDDTAESVKKLGTAAKDASTPIADVGEGLSVAADKAPKAATGVDNLATAAGNAGPKFSNMKSLALTAFGGIAAGIGTAGIAIAIGAMSTAAIGFAQEISSSQPEINRALESHHKLISGIKDLYSEADTAASNYGNSSLELATFQTQQDISGLQQGFAHGQSDLIHGTFGNAALRALLPFPTKSNGLGVENDIQGSAFGGLVKEFREELKSGEADIISFRQRVVEIANALPRDDKSNLSIADRLIGQTGELAEVQQELQSAIDIYQGLSGDADAMATAIGGSAEKIAKQHAAIDEALPSLKSYLEAYRDIAKISPPQTSNGGFLSGLGYASGGFTGHMPADQVAGYVHGQEYVFNARATAAIGVENLDAMQAGVKGYATGGYVGSYQPQSSSYAGYGGASASPFTNIVTDLFALPELANAARGPVLGFLQDINGVGGEAISVWDASLIAAASFFDTIRDKAFSLAANGIVDIIFGAIGGAFGGGLNFTPGGTNALTGLPALFDTGGWTGDGNPADLAGGVHNKEFVVRAGPAAAYRPMLEAINAGQAPAGVGAGGFTFAPHTTINIKGEGVTQAQVSRSLDERDKLAYESFAATAADLSRRGAMGGG